MKKTILAIAAAATIAVGTLSAPTEADARCRFNCAVGLGILGAVVGTAIIANSYPRYAVAPGYAAYDGYAAPYPVDCPGGYWARRPIRDVYGNVVGFGKPRFFCP
jgi:hypothetical protein